MREFGFGVLGLAIGGLGVKLADSWAATHALNASGQDAPAQGQTYNAEAAATPIWMNWKRLAASAVGIFLPFLISSQVRGSGAKSFWQLAGFGALGYTGVKALTDITVWSPLSKQAMVQRLLAPEIAAKSDLNTANVAVLPPIQALTAHTVGTAGLPRGLGRGVGQSVLPNAVTVNGQTFPAGSTYTAVTSRAQCPPGSGIVDAGLDGMWCVTPPSVTPPPVNPPMPPPPMPPPPGGGGGGGGGGAPPGGCPLPPSPPSMNVCTPLPPGGLTPPYAGGGGGGSSCCDSCGRGGPCQCTGITQAQMDWSNTLAMDHN